MPNPKNRKPVPESGFDGKPEKVRRPSRDAFVQGTGPGTAEEFAPGEKDYDPNPKKPKGFRP